MHRLHDRLDAVDEILWPPRLAHLRGPAIAQGFNLSRTPTLVAFHYAGTGTVVRAPIEPLESPIVSRVAYRQLLDALHEVGYRDPNRTSTLVEAQVPESTVRAG